MESLYLENLIEDAKKEMKKAGTPAQKMYHKGKLDAFRYILDNASIDHMFTIVYPDGQTKSFELKKR